MLYIALWSQQNDMLNLIANWCLSLPVGLSLVVSLSMVLYLTAMRMRQCKCLPPGSNDSTIRIAFQLLRGIKICIPVSVLGEFSINDLIVP